MRRFIVSTNVCDITVYADQVDRIDEELIFLVDEEIVAAFKQWNYWKEYLVDLDLKNKNGRAHR